MLVYQASTEDDESPIPIRSFQVHRRMTYGSGPTKDHPPTLRRETMVMEMASVRPRSWCVVLPYTLSRTISGLRLEKKLLMDICTSGVTAVTI